MFQALASGGFQQGLIIFGIYSLTTATFMVVTALISVFAKNLITKSIKSVLPIIIKVSPYIIILAGLYLIYFQLKAFYL